VTGIVLTAAVGSGCQPKSADAQSDHAGATPASAVATNTQPSSWPIDPATGRLKQFTKHQEDLAFNPTLALLNMFPDGALPDEDITAIGVTVVTLEELEDLIDAGGWGLLDVRKPADVAKTGVIPGAVHHTYSFDGSTTTDPSSLTREVADEILHEYPKGVIVYCNGPKCYRSYNACLALVQLWGHPGARIRWFRGGAPAWRRTPLIPESTTGALPNGRTTHTG